jgi:lipopolysaccharide/colanic/teichoic acid biosynthesis glycosyltransferase
MAYSHAKRIEGWVRATDIVLVVGWCVVAFNFPNNKDWMSTLGYISAFAWYFSQVMVGGQNPVYFFPRYRVLFSTVFALALTSAVGIVWAGGGHDWYMKGGLLSVGVLSVGGLIVRLLLAQALQRPAIQLVPCRLPARFQPLLDELAAHPNILVDHPLDDPAGPLPERRPGYPTYLVVSDLRVREDDFTALTPLYPRVEIADLCEFYEAILGKVAVVRGEDGWTLPQALRVPSPLREVAKRAFDTVLILLTLPLTLPLTLLGMLLVRLSSRGPVFFRQARLGRYGGTFTLVKLRTMVVDAEAGGPQWTGAGDARVTPLGRLLRTTGLDELPQLWNVLCGDMSLVGPRPERPEIVAQLEHAIPFYRARLLVAPGLTGWAQLHQGGDTTLEDVVNKLRYDLYYLKYGTPLLDLRILFGTLQMVLHLAKPAPKKAPAAPAEV